VIIARHVPSLAPVAARVFSLGNESRLRKLFEDAGFEDIRISTHAHRFSLESFDAYFEHVERGWGSAGEAFVALPEAMRRLVREEVCSDVGDKGGPIEIEVEFRFASGRK
jgi:hypothetical protein